MKLKYAALKNPALMAPFLLMGVFLLWCVFDESMVLPVRAAEVHAGQTYVNYYAALKTARSFKDLAPFVREKELAKLLEKSDDYAAMRQLSWMKKRAPKDLRIVYEKMSAPMAVLEVSGLILEDGAEEDAPRVRKYGSVRLVNENGWKVMSESWFDQPLGLAVLRDKPTVDWCAGAVNASVRTAPPFAKLRGAEQEFVSARFTKNVGALLITTHTPQGHAHLTVQLPPTINELHALTVRKPGGASSGVKIGLEVEPNGDPGRILNVWDADDPYGIKLDCFRDSDNCTTCSMNLRLPDRQRSEVSAKFTVEER